MTWPTTHIYSKAATGPEQPRSLGQTTERCCDDTLAFLDHPGTPCGPTEDFNRLPEHAHTTIPRLHSTTRHTARHERSQSPELLASAKSANAASLV